VTQIVHGIYVFALKSVGRDIAAVGTTRQIMNHCKRIGSVKNPKSSPFVICNWVAKRYKAKHGRAWPKKKHESCIRQLKKQLQHSK